MAGLCVARQYHLTALSRHSLASVTDFIVDPIVDAATEFIDSVGLIGVFVLMLLEIGLHPGAVARRSCSSPASTSPRGT